MEDCPEKNPPNLGRDIVLKEVRHNCPLLNCGLCRETSFHRVQYGKGEGGNFTIEIPDSITSSR